MIGKAHKMGLLTTPYAFNPNEALQMAKAGADIIVAHMGLTTSGSIGAKTALSLEDSVLCVQAIADATHRINPDAIVLCHGGIYNSINSSLPCFIEKGLLIDKQEEAPESLKHIIFVGYSDVDSKIYMIRYSCLSNTKLVLNFESIMTNLQVLYLALKKQNMF